MTSPKLAVFDFDYTIIDDNSDTAVMNLIDKTQITPDVWALYKADGWTAFMQGIFKLLLQHNKDENMVKDLIKTLPAVHGMPELITSLNDNNYDIIIISDSNSFFIDTWLEHNKLKDKVLKVFSNPAEYVDGLLKIEMYHFQDTCKLSSKNLCKGQILEDFIKSQAEKSIIYERVIYVGDGANDFCPMLRLNKKDLACAREGFRIIETINRAKSGSKLDPNGKPYELKAEVFVWKDGFQIIEKLNLQ